MLDNTIKLYDSAEVVIQPGPFIWIAGAPKQ